MLQQDGLYLIPLHTAFELTVNLTFSRLGCYFNGDAVFFGGKPLFVETVRNPQTGYEVETLTGLGKALFDCRFTRRSPQLAEYGLSELCMELDDFYGLKESHSIDSFGWLMLDSGLC